MHTPTPRRHFTLQPLRRSALLMALLGTAGLAQAAWQVGSVGQTDAERAELLLIIWDPVAKVQYTKDLNVWANADFNGTSLFGEKYPTEGNFFITGQQDGGGFIAGQSSAGGQTFFPKLNSDLNFQEFLKVSSSPANQVWGIVGGARQGAENNRLQRNLYSTLKSTSTDGVLNPNYKTMQAIPNQEVEGAISFLELNVAGTLNLAKDKNGGTDGNLFNSHKFVDATNPDFSGAGSSFDLYSTNELSPYLDKPDSVLAGGRLNFQAYSFDIMNKVGESSWFYYLTPSNDTPESTIAIDEFDNLKHDAYWGLAKDSEGDYILSFTLAPLVEPTRSPQGLQRRNLTDFSAWYGQARQVAAASDEFLGWGASVTAVPEPGTYGLMALGLLVLGVRARKSA